MKPMFCLPLTVLVLAAVLPIPPADAAPAAPAPQLATTPLDQRITHEQLVERLAALGFATPQPVESIQGTPLYLLEFNENHFNFVIYVGLSPDGSRLFFNAPLRPLPETSGRFASALLQLLEKNHAIAPLNFNYNATTGYLYLTYGVENQSITPARLRQMMASMMTVLRETEPLWDTARWGETAAPDETAAAPVAPPADAAVLDADAELARMQGTWRVVAFESNGVSATPEQLQQLPHLVITGATLELAREGALPQVFTIESIDATTPQPAFDLKGAFGFERAIYTLSGDRLEIALSPVNGARPTNFTSSRDGTVVLKLVRVSDATV